jgi:mRNA interferase RelE/StbE
MQSKFRDRFNKDISKITEKKVISEIHAIIINVDNAKIIADIKNIKRLKGSKKAYRIRAGEYRCGIYVVNGVVEFTRFLHRKDIYKFFP